MSVLKLFLGFLIGLIACAILLALVSIRSPILAEADTLATRKVAEAGVQVEEVGEQNGNKGDDAEIVVPEPQATEDATPVDVADAETAPVIAEPQPAEDLTDTSEPNDGGVDQADLTLPVQPETTPTDQPDVAQVPEPTVPAPAPTPKVPEVVALKTQGNTLELGAGSSRLPKISDTSTGSRLKLASERDAEPPAPDASNADASAFRDNAEDLVDLNRPLISVVLLDIGATGVPQSDLLSQTLPFTFGVDGSRSDAGRVSGDYRDAGFEVVSVLSDAAVEAISAPEQGVALVQNALNNMPDALAVLDGVSAQLQKNKQVYGPILAALAENGHGVLSYKIGLNTGFKDARKAGLISGSVYRTIAGDITDPNEAVRVMDRAVFEASREGAAIVFAVATPPVVQGIRDWSTSAGANAVTFAPVSSAMTKLSR